MATFEFYQDMNVSIWQRMHFSIEAETEEEAKKIALQFKNKDVSKSKYFERMDWLHDTEEPILPDDKGGQDTIQLFVFGEETPFATNATDEYKQQEASFDEYMSAHQAAYREMAGYTAECTYDEDKVFYRAWHKDDKIHVAVLKPQDVALIYRFPCGWDELIGENVQFRSQMVMFLNKKYHDLPQRHNEVIDWLTGCLTRMVASSEAVDDAVPFTLKDLIDAAGDMASVSEYRPVPLVGYQVVAEDNSLPEGLFSFQIIRDRKMAFLTLEKARDNHPDKDYQIYPVYEGDVEEPAFI